jgi:hypothetical protein
MKCKFLKRYRYHGVNYRPGDEAELTELEARHINRDEPGTLEVVPEPAPERTLDKPPADRMVKAAKKRSKK